MKDDTQTFRDKLRKIEALQKGGSTSGERAAAAAAAAAADRVRLALPVSITCTILNIDRRESFYEVQYRDVENESQTINLPRELFQRPQKVVEQLLKAGAALPDDFKAATETVKRALDLKADTTRRLTERAGWYEVESFVYPGGTFGKLAGSITYDSPSDLDPALGLQAGSLESWREGLRDPCKHSDYLIIAIGHKAASALLGPIGEDEGYILHIHGTETGSADKSGSSSGKSLTSRVAASMTGRARKNDLVTFAISGAGLCDLCFTHNNLGIELDEEGRSLASGTGPRVQSDELSYLVSSGRGSVRSNFASRHPELKNCTWTTNAITSGELPLDGTSSRSPRTEGSQVRMIGLPVPPGAKGGIFNRVKGKQKKRLRRCKELAEQTEATIASNYGVVFPAYLSAIVARRADLSGQMQRLIAELVSEVGADTNPWDRRFAQKLATDAAGAILLSDLGIGPWSKKRTINAFKRCYRKARAVVATVPEISEHLISRIMKRHSKGRFHELSKGKTASRRSAARAVRGFRKELPGIGPAILIPMTELEKIVQHPGVTSQVIQHLAQQGLVHVGDDGKVTRQVLIKGLADQRRRYVCFDVDALSKGRKKK